MTEDTDASAAHDEELLEEVGYARVLPRVQAMLIDIAWYMVFAFVCFGVSELFPSRLGFIAFMAIMVPGLLLYEPVLVSRWGGTIGHRAMNLEIVSATSGRRLRFFPALWRAWVKGMLGIISFFTMVLTSRHQALHDLASRSTVQIRDLRRAKPGHYRLERDDLVEIEDVSRTRRVFVILGYSALTFVGLSFASIFAISDACAFNDVCTPGEDLLFTAVSFAWMIATGVVIVLGWRGRLFGARTKGQALSGAS